jgi:DNA polymerase-1
MTNSDKRLFLIDAYAMIFRGYYALIRNPRLTSKGFDTSAIFGFTNSLIELIRREKPTHLAVVFDVGKENVRTADFTEYKANRSDTPEAIKNAVPYIHRILEAMHIPILGVEGYKAIASDHGCGVGGRNSRASSGINAEYLFIYPS